MKADILHSLQGRGWALTKTESDTQMLGIAMSLGNPCPSRANSPLIDLLRPIPREQAHKASLSAIHGQGSFPFHIDTAHWRIPARYVLLRAIEVDGDSHPTLVLDKNNMPFHHDEVDFLQRGVFSVRNGKKSFLSPIKPAHAPFIRFDIGCMSPKSMTAAAALKILNSKISAVPAYEVKWSTGDTLIIDNWRCLHARGHMLNPTACRRTLSRVLVVDSL